MEEELKPCPFCGQKVKAFENLKDESNELIECWTVIHDCPTTKAQTICDGLTEIECTQRWNTRAPSPTERKLGEALEWCWRQLNEQTVILDWSSRPVTLADIIATRVGERDLEAVGKVLLAGGGEEK